MSIYEIIPYIILRIWRQRRLRECRLRVAHRRDVVRPRGVQRGRCLCPADVKQLALFALADPVDL